MDGLFKKTMSYLNTEGVVQDEFVGKVVEVATIKLKIIRKIAEGKYFTQERIFSCFVVIFVFRKSHDFSLGEMITECGWTLLK